MLKKPATFHNASRTRSQSQAAVSAHRDRAEYIQISSTSVRKRASVQTQNKRSTGFHNDLIESDSRIDCDGMAILDGDHRIGTGW